MKRAVSLALLAAPLFATPAFADIEKGPYLGIGGGTEYVSSTLASFGVDDGTTSGLVLGYRFTDVVSLEVMINESEFDTTFPGCTMESSTKGVFGAVRTKGTAYLKGRVGLLNEDVTATGVCGGASAGDTGLSYGIGAGVRLGMAALELEYTLIEADVSRLNANLLFNF